MNTPTNFDHTAPAKAEPCLKSNQCYFHRHDECWMSNLCECTCHQQIQVTCKRCINCGNVLIGFEMRGSVCDACLDTKV